MSKCCGGNGHDANRRSADPCAPPTVACAGQGRAGADGPMAHFGRMIENCLAHARAAHEAGVPVVGILCEYTPRELILAAGAVPVCLCGGSAGTIPAAEEHLPANLCPLIKSTFGYHVSGTNPFLELADLLVAETTCDGKKKMYELMAQSRPMHVLELPQQPDTPAAAEHWLAELRRLRSVLEARYGVTITDERLREAIRQMNRERALRRQLAELMALDRPPLTGRRLLELKSSISAQPEDFAQYQAALAQLRDAPAAAPASAIRVLLTGVPIPHGAERVLDIIEDTGGLVVAQENCTGLKPILEDVDEAADDPLAALAQKYLHMPCSVMSPNDRRLESLAALAGQYRPQCVIELTWQACLTYDVESARVRRFVEGELHLPYLQIVTDYSPSDSARIAVRVEALFETVASGARPRGAAPAANRPGGGSA